MPWCQWQKSESDFLRNLFTFLFYCHWPQESMTSLQGVLLCICEELSWMEEVLVVVISWMVCRTPFAINVWHQCHQGKKEENDWGFLARALGGVCCLWTGRSISLAESTSHWPVRESQLSDSYERIYTLCSRGCHCFESKKKKKRRCFTWFFFVSLRGPPGRPTTCRPVCVRMNACVPVSP